MAEQPESLWRFVRGRVLFIGAAIMAAVAVSSQLEELIKVSSWVRWFTASYRFHLLNFYKFLGDLIGVNISPLFWDLVVILGLSISVVIYQVRHNDPRVVDLSTLDKKLSWLFGRVSLAFVFVFSATLLIGATISQSFWLASSVVFFQWVGYGIYALRTKQRKYDGDHRILRFFIFMWLGIGALVLLSQTEVLEFFLGAPPTLPPVDYTSPFDHPPKSEQ